MAPWFFQFLLVPVEKEIHMYSRNTWEMVDKLSHSDITGVGVAHDLTNVPL